MVPCVWLYSDMCAFVYMFAGLGLLLLNALCSLLLNSRKCDSEMWVSFVENSFVLFYFKQSGMFPCSVLPRIF